MRSTLRSTQRGSALLLAILLILALAVIGAAVIRWAGNDRTAAARLAVQERGLSCTEAGIQYGRRYFGCNYKKTNNWNAILSGAAPGRYDPSLGDAYPASVADIDARLKGDSKNSGTLDPGTDLDGDGKPDFWVSIRDDDDERPLGADDNKQRDNNLMVWLRAECINPVLAAQHAVGKRSTVVEVLLAYVPGATSPYGKATSASDFPAASAGGPSVITTVSNCD